MRSLFASSPFLVLCSLVACADPDAVAEQSPDSPAEATPVCPAPSASGRAHRGDIAEDQVWRAADGPHYVEEDVTIRAGATLTLEPCTVVELRQGRSLRVVTADAPRPSALRAVGDAARPIVFRSADEGPWGSLLVEEGGHMELAHVSMDGGGETELGEVPMLHVLGDGVMPADPMLLIDSVSMQNARATGLRLERGASFVQGSRQLSISASGAGTADWPTYPLEIDEHSIDTVPSGTYRGNAHDEILVVPYGNGATGGGLTVDTTLRARGVPYHLGRSAHDSLVLGSDEPGDRMTLTIEAGVELRMEPGTGVKIQAFSRRQPATAALRALGTAESPIVFTSAASTPAPGDWVGLWFGGNPAPNNTLEHVRIEYAGHDCGCSLDTCSDISQHEAAVLLTGQPERTFIHDTTFKDIAGHGVHQGFDGASLDFVTGNRFENVAGCKQTRPRNADTTCPDPRPACE